MRSRFTLVAGTLASAFILADLSGCARHYNAFRPDAETTQAINREVVRQKVEFAAFEADPQEVQADVADETARTGLPADAPDNHVQPE